MKTILDKRINIRFLILMFLIIIVGGQAHAESQFDIGMNVPYYAGLRTTVLGTVGQFSKYLYVLPDVKWHWYFGTESLRFGPGLRVWTLILESAIYPQISLEAVLGDFVINAGIGGGAFFFFGVFNTFQTASIFIPELSLAYRLGKKKKFSLGTSALFVISPDVAPLLDNFIYIGTVFARWTI